MMKLRVVLQAEGKSRDAQHPDFAVEDTRIANEAKTLNDIQIVLSALTGFNSTASTTIGAPLLFTDRASNARIIVALPEVYMTGSGYVSSYI